MRVDAIAFGTLEPCLGHYHLEWTCPDCDDFWSLAHEYGPYRYQCVKTNRWLLVVVIDRYSPLAGRPFEPHRRGRFGALRAASPTPTGADEHEQSTMENRINGQPVKDILD